MCGIAGFYNSRIQSDEGNALLGNMLKSTSHRGPDYTGALHLDHVFLGHNRLSIIDLSDEANQPMVYEHLTIVFNGEIYNYLEIKQELINFGYKFKTHSDTEVILASYLKWGKQCQAKFVGMWAFAIWDDIEKELFCSRDRFGIKPFYYFQPSESEFYFASEYKPFKQIPGFKKDPNVLQISRGLQLGWLSFQDESYYNDLKILPAAHYLLFKNGKVIIERYWDIDFEKTISGNFKEKQEQFLSMFDQSIGLHMRSDVPLAATLSGGIDSSAIVSYVLASNKEQHLKTFSIYYEGNDSVDERPFINEVVSKYNRQISPFYFSPNENDVKEHFHRAMYHCDVPATGSSFISQYFVMKLIAEHGIKVVLSGQGADDYLGGYMHSFYRLFADNLKNGQLLKLSKGINTLKKEQEYGFGKTVDLFSKSILSSLLKESSIYNLEYKRYYPFLLDKSIVVTNPLPIEDKGNNKLNSFLYQLSFNSSLPSLLHYEDRNSMAYSIESRVPFLDHRLVEYAFSLRNEDKIYKGSTKHILRTSLQPYLPEKITNRKDKKGFVTPGEVKWLRGTLSYLLEDDFKELTMLDIKKVRQIVDEFKKGNNKNANLVWRIASLNYWLKNIH